MQMDAGDARLLLPVTERTIGCAFRLAKALGHGFDPTGFIPTDPASSA
jgi:hypothetical protein